MVLEKTTTINQSLNTQKGYLVSIVLHALLAGVLALLAVDEVKPIEIPMRIELELSTLTDQVSSPKTPIPSVAPSSQQTVSKPTAFLNPSVQQPVQPISPLVTVPVSEPSVVKEQPKSVSLEAESIVAQKAVESVKPVLAAKSDAELENEFVKTNFGMIRDSVLSKLLYPNIARRMGQTGVVEVAIVIGTNGKLKNHFISKSSGFPLLDEAALKAVATLGSESLPKPQVESRVILPISFKLKA
jgi:protein TonB